MKTKLVFIAIFIISNYVMGQEFNWIPTLKKNITDSDYVYLTKRASLYSGGKFDFNFNYDIEDINPREKSDKKLITNYEDEIKKIEKELKNIPNDAWLYLKIANIFSNSGKFWEAYDNYSKSISLFDQLIKANTGNSYYYRAVAQIYATGLINQDKAIAFYQKAISINKNDTASYNGLIMVMLKNNHYNEARFWCTKLMKNLPDYAGTYVFLTMVTSFDFFSKYYKEKDVTKYKNLKLEEIFDLKPYQNAVDAHKNNFSFELVCNLSKQYLLIVKLFTINSENGLEGLKLNDNDNEIIKELRNFYTKALKRKDIPNLYILYYSLGTLDICEAKYNEAIANYRKAISDREKYKITTSNNTGKIFNNIVVSHVLMKDTVGAVLVLEEKIKKLPEKRVEINDYDLIARLCLFSKNYGKSKQTAAEALKINPNSSSTNRIMCINYLYEKDFNYASLYANNASKLSPNEGENFILSGIISLLQNSKAFALSYFQSAYKLNPKDEVLNEILNKYYMKKEK